MNLSQFSNNFPSKKLNQSHIQRGRNETTLSNYNPDSLENTERKVISLNNMEDSFTDVANL